MRFRVLGPLEINGEEYALTPQAPKLRSVLAALLLNYNRSVHTDSLIDELWHDNPPASCHTTLQTYIYQLRKIFAAEGRRNGPIATIVTRPSGYAIELDPTEFDLHVFARLAEKGTLALESGSPRLAATRLREALDLWRDDALVDVQRGLLLQAHSARLEEERLRTLESRIEADLRLARHRRLTSELRSLTIRHPLHEGLHAKLMLSLYRSQRQHEALQTYQRLRETLDRELGVGPSVALERLQHAILNADRSLDPAPVPGAPVEAGQQRAVPAQLPRDTGDFSGREAELAAVEKRLREAAEVDSSAVPIVLVTGGLGSGKTAFLVHAGHRLREHYPHGQFFADLRGSSTQPADPAQLLGEMLQSLGVRRGEIPGAIEERSRLFRSLLSDRRMLLVLDDALSLAQVSPLLPGCGRSAVLIGSRTPMPELPSALPIELGELTDEEAAGLLDAIAGDGRVARDPESATALIGIFGRLPLALRAVGTRIRAAGAQPLAVLAAQLSRPRHPLAELGVRNYDVRSGLEDAYRRLDERHRGVFRALARLRLDTFDAHTALRFLVEQDTPADRRTLEALQDNGLLHTERDSGTVEPRYRLPELMRLFAEEKRASEPAEEVPQQRDRQALGGAARSGSEAPWIVTSHDPS